MSASEVVMLFLTCYSLTFGWIESPLFNKIKKIKFFQHDVRRYLTFCYHCAGFWISVVVIFIYSNKFILTLMLALSFSIVMLWLNTILVLLQSFIKKEE